MILLVASIIEPIWVTCLDKSENFKKKGWGAAAVILVLLCLYLLSIPSNPDNLGPGISYSILAGIGAAGIVLIGRVLYKEKITARKMLFIIMIVAGIIGVRIISG
ncbi:MAG: quaternary ammonium compound-resistance protein SugE [Candidatus Methanomethylophilaceae archaeon]|nr:quaternary ammonium compound-resistance protein SugE [Candidatus Methanomethylophilaceae archaeon]MBR6214170.1 quaternary ammonium compound-resistance protein SugE [Candidatus Methanomethylophilaceae archaeon]